MKILFLGAGGVSGYFGGRLIEAGADVSFLVRPGRQAQLASDGLRIESPHGNLKLAVNAVTQESVTAAYDLVVFAPKAYDLDKAIASIVPAIGPATSILPLLNGLAHMAILDKQFGRKHVLGGVAHIAAMMTPEGSIKQLTELHSLTVGARDPEAQAMAEDFSALCRQARFDSRLAPDIDSVLWEKWVFLSSLAGITTLMRAPIGQIMDTDRGDHVVRTLYAECLAVAAAEGFPIADSAQQKALGMLTQKGSSFTASMLRDLESGQRTEHEHILGDMLKRAARHEIA
ncbi:MAG: ketopantoate reductase family protein, partial [Sulfuritalea sp.]|nr:ketopantoate reductase family protein [Sulfuritalea sp.]